MIKLRHTPIVTAYDPLMTKAELERSEASLTSRPFTPEEREKWPPNQNTGKGKACYAPRRKP